VEILPVAEREGIGMIVYSPMASGLLSGAMTRERIAALPADDWRRHSEEFREPQLTQHLELVERLRLVAAQREWPAHQEEAAPPQQEWPAHQEEAAPPQQEWPTHQEEAAPPQQEWSTYQEEAAPPQQEWPTYQEEAAPLQQEWPAHQEEAAPP
jgi:hypothetical protein